MPPKAPGSQFAVFQAAAPSLGVEVRPVNMHDVEEIERAVTAFALPARHDRGGGPDRDASSRFDRQAERLGINFPRSITDASSLPAAA